MSFSAASRFAASLLLTVFVSGDGNVFEVWKAENQLLDISSTTRISLYVREIWKCSSLYICAFRSSTLVKMASSSGTVQIFCEPISPNAAACCTDVTNMLRNISKASIAYRQSRCDTEPCLRTCDSCPGRRTACNCSRCCSLKNSLQKMERYLTASCKAYTADRVAGYIGCNVANQADLAKCPNTTATKIIDIPPTVTREASIGADSSSKSSTQPLVIDVAGNGASPIPSATSSASSPPTAAVSEGNADESHAGAVGGIVAGAALLLLIVVVSIFMWRRRRKDLEERKGTDTVITASSDTQSIVNFSFGSDETGYSPRKETENGPITTRAKRNSEHKYTHIDSVINLRPNSTRTLGEKSVHNELDDVADRKLPTDPALGDNYSLAQNPSRSQNQPSANVYTLARNPESRVEKTPKCFILEEERRMSSADDQVKGPYFILEGGAANDETGEKKGTQPQAAPNVHSANVYLALDSSARGENSSAEYTPLSHTSKDKRAQKTADPTNEGGKDNQYFILEENAANDDQEEGQSGQYFILEEDAAKDEKGQEKNGQYFLLEEDEANGNTAQDARGQCFILEDDAAKDDQEQERCGQYFVLGEDAAVRDNKSKTDPQSSTQEGEGEYSHLDPADRGDNGSDHDREYTPLWLVSTEGPREKPASDGGEYFELESDYSLAKQVGQLTEGKQF